MADTTIAINNTITFLDSHKPGLQSGEYSIDVSHTVSVNGNPPESFQINGDPKNTSPSPFQFKVEGPQFAIDDNLIHSVYPPTGSKGDFHADIPSITLNRSTLPWERSPGEGDYASWLCLLVIDESEIKNVTEVVNEPLTDVNKALFGLTDIFDGTIKINYIKIEQALIGILPSTGDLNYLSYARISKEDGGEEKAVIIANRLPKKGATSTVYLVSVENRYNSTGFNNSDASQPICLPFLYKWQFHADDETNYFIPNESTDVSDSALKNVLFLNTESFIAALKEKNITDSQISGYKKNYAIGNGSFHGLLKDLKGGCSSFSFPSTKKETDFLKLINQGAVAAKHTSDIAETVSWYRGPFQANKITFTVNSDFLPPFKPNSTTSPNKLPLQSEQLFLYDPDTKMCDVSYAAAWELGKLTALNDKVFNVPFYKWKQNNVLVKRQIELGQNIHNLAVSSSLSLQLLPEVVLNKFAAWKQLKGIPLHYLIPNAKMTPSESIRHFKVDKYWINSFLCGVFSIGNTIEVDLSEYLIGDSSNGIPPNFMNNDVSGFILNSKVITGWPDFELDADGATLLRRDNILPNMALFLFDQTFNKLTFHLHAGKMHSGFVFDDKYKKNGIEVPFRNFDRVINISDLAKSKIANIDSTNTKVAEFAAAMLESTPQVAFLIK